MLLVYHFALLTGLQLECEGIAVTCGQLPQASVD